MRPCTRFCFPILVASILSLGFAFPAAGQGPRRIQPSAAAQISVIQQLKTSRTPAQGKIDSRLFLGILHLGNDARLAPLTEFRFLRPDPDGKIAVDVRAKTAEGIKPILARIVRLGGEVKMHSRVYRSVRARLPMNQVDSLASLAEVLFIQPAVPAFTHAVNVSQGDVTHRAAEARTFFGVQGLGVKICVLSDGVDSLSFAQGTGDLPAVDVLPGQEGFGDEGTAMLEIVHDLAPGAELGFATAFSGETSFAQNIRDLRFVAGCDVIVDDVIYLDESPFQDNDVAESVNVVTADGALYFSSAGNEGNLDDATSGTWEGNFKPNGTVPAAGTGTAHDFGDGGQSNFVTAFADRVVLHWTDPFFSAANDYDIYDMDDGLTKVFDASFNTQDGVGGDDIPFEIMGFAFVGERLVALQFAGADRMLNMIAFRGGVENATSGTTRGHSAAVNAFSTAAVDVATALPGPFVGGAGNPVETFSSDGPRRIFFDNAGNLLPGAPPGDFSATGGVVRQKPDLAAADGVSTSAPGFDPFYGTSAAAPHAAAIAGLVKSAFPAFTPAQIRTALLGSALDIEAAGVDRDSGAGITMAYETLAALGATLQPVLALGTVTPSEAAGDGDAFIEPNEDWNLSIQLQNIGGATATGITAELSTTTPGVRIVRGTSAYPDLSIAPRGTGVINATPFTFTLLGTAPCGGAINLQLTVTYSGGNNSSQTFDLPALETGAPGPTVTIPYGGPVIPIPDAGGGTAIADLAVGGIGGRIRDVDFRFDGSLCTADEAATTVGLDHTYVSDLQILLISPTGSGNAMIQFAGGSGNNFCQTLLDDESAGPSIESTFDFDAPYTGSFTPANSLSIFDGEDPNGTWHLQVDDFAGADIGNIRAFSLIIAPVVCNSPAHAANVTATKTASGTGQPGSTLTYTIVLSNSGTGAALDNAGPEFTDTLPANLSLPSAVATSGTITTGGNTVDWNGGIVAGGSVTITIQATVLSVPGPIVNQGTLALDPARTGSATGAGLTDDPTRPGASDPTVVGGVPPITEIPTLSTVGFAVLAALLAALGLTTVRRRRRV
ncbi:MAG TPA: IPTL-CTERM sorting domain-containing protein [Thermoanaerobaculia bacterium]|jgi:uncharacterized repeat protein (TIGR01451 family)|nr:IPTL-CTERM sorting domain-containing protein [Thermoanaerobaculia bacterium]